MAPSILQSPVVTTTQNVFPAYCGTEAGFSELYEECKVLAAKYPEQTITMDCRRATGKVTLRYRLVKPDAPHKLLLVAGAGEPIESLWFQIAYLSKQAPDYSVCVYEQRGTKHSVYTHFGVTTCLFALDAFSLVDALGWSRFHVMGSSMGGMIVQEMACDLIEGKRVLSLALVSTHAGGLGSIPPIESVWKVPAMVTPRTPAACGRTMCAVLFPDSFKANHPDRWQLWCQIFAESFSEPRSTDGVTEILGIVSQFVATFRHNVTPQRLRKICESPIPVMVVTGDEDYLVRPSNSVYLHKHLGGTLHIMKGCGHTVYNQEPHIFGKLLVEHLRNAEMVWERTEGA